VKENLDQLKEDLTNLGKTIKTLNQTLEKVNSGQGTVGELINDSSLYDETRSAINEVKNLSSAISAIKPKAGLEGSYYGESDLFKGSLYGGLTWKDRGLLLAGVTHDPFQDKFVYSLQGGFKAGPLAFRAGLIESNFGAGVDWYVLKTGWPSGPKALILTAIRALNSGSLAGFIRSKIFIWWLAWTILP